MNEKDSLPRRVISIPPELHLELKQEALTNGVTMQTLVEKKLRGNSRQRRKAKRKAVAA